MSVTVASLGFPRIGPRRELKTTLERYWSGKSDQGALLAVAADLRARTWARQKELGVDHVPSSDFSFYDHVLDTSVMVGAVPAVYGWTRGPVDLDTYFAMARGAQGEAHADCSHCCTHKVVDVPAAEMTKWFDTNYHYLVPEFSTGQAFALSSTKIVDEFLEAKAQGIHTRPVLLGPVTYIRLGKSQAGEVSREELLCAVLPVYEEVLRRLSTAGADWVQIDEPCLVLDLTHEDRTLLATAYGALAEAAPAVKLMLTTYFGGLGDNLDTAVALPVAGLHIDLIRAPEQLDAVLAKAPKELALSLGVVDGRNVWRTDLEKILAVVEPVARARDIVLAPSCSLLHTPIDLAQETTLDEDVRRWLAFAVQKLEELSTLARALNGGRDGVAEALAASSAAAAARKTSPKIHDAAVAARLAAADAALARRGAAFPARRELQVRALGLPAFPTTTIGSFPQTEEVRKARAAHGKGMMTDADYGAFLREETARTVRWQEEIGLDVLVHGEFERNDMVQYFGERLSGFIFTKHSWVQSYGSRCVRPPILFGDVSRPKPMTVAWWSYAQGLTDKPMKGMLTGPVTILNWSFVRDDVTREQACRQIALAIRDEVVDLEKAGAKVIQIDEAALREGLPLRRSDWQQYLGWAVESFRIASSGVADATQIHTHMCYSEFNDIIAAIGSMDADVISIETARSKMELLSAFAEYRYPAEIGPGVYDIHSPRVPAVEEMTDLLAAARSRLSTEQLWVNPDCGLKTRKWPETRAALVNMVAAAKQVREVA
ncbi:5-methyltetrahydropteroyltriglutamate--homocysteine S-methyltransferase [Roseomonas sp. KE2513]|uniref:5-methyltetrahydropteroyltriglutamate-- homocysteine S-methyltransferase n=1 Tax=Roseomonas sp. KE2513 TaxID=2479202 RepID=UPI0018E007B4|nr:5-methyltetrahydropteroyltriglutamate--homocysteine S-methyltransferase [Roseomonas sp. KE2513]MBI0539428.1 5-methyltetrahydropteroyltriglutamate--homocysteine S-methyltransferase [Roseomonas sp. KE2513]